MKKQYEKIKRQLLADKKKLAIVCVLFLVAVFMWLKMFVGGNSTPATAQASTPSAATTPETPDQDAPLAKPAKIVTVYVKMASDLSRNEMARWKSRGIGNFARLARKSY